MCAIQNNVAKIEGKHFVFKTSIAEIHTRLLIDNGSKAELIDEFFACSNKISTFQLEKLIQLMLNSGKVVQHLIKRCLVNVVIGDHHKQILCYLAKLDVCAVTIKNWYSILLINKTLEKLTNAVYFTKLDIIATFNRMRMKEGQE